MKGNHENKERKLQEEIGITNKTKGPCKYCIFEIQGKQNNMKPEKIRETNLPEFEICYFNNLAYFSLPVLCQCKLECQV